MSRILFVDDDHFLRDRISKLLSTEGYEVFSAKDGTEAVKKCKIVQPDLLLLDVEMPKKNGFAVCSELKESGITVPIVFFTAHNSETNELRALGLGADDFIDKASSEAVWLARIRRVIDRSSDGSAANIKSHISELQIGSSVVDLERALIVNKQGSQPLTATEMSLLELLASDRDRYFPAEQIMTALRGRGYACTPGLLHSHFYNLREKLGSDDGLIENRRGVGYRLKR